MDTKAAFEKWYLKVSFCREMVDGDKDIAWAAWQASRESIEICTPNPNYNFGGKSEDYKTGFSHRVLEMNRQWTESITSQGIKVKS